MSQHTMKRMAPAAMVAVLATGLVAAQNAPLTEQRTVFRAETNYVSTNVQVRDKQGRFVPDLRASEFRVYEDGVPQQITSFSSVVGGRLLNNLSVSAPAAPPATEGLVLPRARPQVDVSGRIFIIFIDDLHFLPAETPRVRQLLQQVRDTLVHEDDVVGFVSTGPSAIEFSPSYDLGHRRFNEAIRRVLGSARSAEEIVKDAQFETQEGPTALRFNVHTAFRTAYDMLDQLRQIKDRRKSFVYVSNGYSYDPLNESRYKRLARDYEATGMSSINPPTQPGDPDNPTPPEDKVRPSDLSPWDILADPAYRRRTMFAELDLTVELAQLVREARRANVIFYAIDPRGVDASLMEASTTQAVLPRDMSIWLAQTQGTLRVLSDETGGFCVCDTNDIKPALQRIDNETSNYYMVGYITSNANPLQIRRTIRIEVTRPGADQLAYRDSYTIPRSSRK